MNLPKTIRIIALLACVSIVTGFAQGDDVTQKAKKIFKSNSDAVLWVHAVVKIQATAEGMPAQNVERKLNVIATMIDDTGLLVCSLSAIDPADSYNGREVRSPTGAIVKISAKSEFAEVKVRLADKTEVPARVVMKDTDWDMAFVQIDMTSEEMKDQKLAVLKMTDVGDADRLDQVVSISRLSKLLKYEPVVNISRVIAIVTKPRKVFVVPGVSVGSPVFLPDGKVLGICLRKKANDSQGSGAFIILPSADILEIAEQAKKAAAKPIEKPVEDPKKPVEDSKDVAPEKG